MGAIDRLPAHGTRARQIHDDAKRARSKPCRCGSGLRTTARAGFTTCIACDPSTKAAYDKIRGKENTK